MRARQSESGATRNRMNLYTNRKINYERQHNFRIGIGGPVGSGKTALIEAITPRLLDMGLQGCLVNNQ